MGSMFVNEECQDCFCLGQNKFQCVDKECPDCQKPFYHHLNNKCECICKACTTGEKYCKSLKICINENLHCSEIGSTESHGADTRYTFDGKVCPSPHCEPGMKSVETEIETLDGCPYYKCLALGAENTCPTPNCPPGFKPEFNNFEIDIRSSKLRQRSYGEIIVDAGLNCPEYECVQVQSSCENIVQPQCGPNQEARLFRTDNGCPKFVCGWLNSC